MNSVPLPSKLDFVGGGLAGMAQVAIGHPLDTVKVRLQMDARMYTDCLAKTIRSEGVLGLYKGMASPLLGISFVNAVLFSAYGWLKNVQRRDPSDSLQLYQIAIAGAGAGFVNSFILGPIELFKIQLQSQVSGHQGLVKVAQHLIQQHGIARGLFKGTAATIAREIPACAGFYAGFEGAKQILQKDNKLSLLNIMAAGSFGGFCYWTCCYPLDVIKTRIQQQTLGHSNILQMGRLIVKEQGIKALFRGYETSVIRSLPAGK